MLILFINTDHRDYLFFTTDHGPDHRDHACHTVCVHILLQIRIAVFAEPSFVTAVHDNEYVTN